MITSSDSSDLDKFKLEMKSLFKMSILGQLRYYLGIEVQQGPSGVDISQLGYAPSCWRRRG